MSCVDLESAARSVVKAATDRALTISTAESCTAGLIASSIADIPGASSVLRGGAVTYCDEIKRDVLGVPEATLQEHTAVSEACAIEMAERSLALFSADVAVSATGYAGPDGGTNADPAGTVYLACSTYRGTMCHRCTFEGNRNDVRQQAVLHALDMVLENVRALGNL